MSTDMLKSVGFGALGGMLLGGVESTLGGLLQLRLATYSAFSTLPAGEQDAAAALANLGIVLGGLYVVSMAGRQLGLTDSALLVGYVAGTAMTNMVFVADADALAADVNGAAAPYITKMISQ